MAAIADRKAATLCVCGSGLSGGRCCGLDLRSVPTAFPDGTDAAQVEAMRSALRQGDHATAGSLAIEVLEEVPGHGEALHVLFNALRRAEQWQAASAVVDRLATVHLNDPVARMTAVQYLLGRNELPRAFFHARMLIRLAPEAVVSHYLMGKTFLAAHTLGAAEHHFRMALHPRIKHGPPVSPLEIEGSLAVTLRHQGRFEEARAILRRLDEENGENLTVLLAWAELEEAATEFTKSAELLDRAVALAPGNAHIAVAKAKLLRRMKQPEQALQLLEEEPEGGNIDAARLIERGQTLDAMGRYDEAFAMFVACKEVIRKRGSTYRADEANRVVKALREFFTEGRDHLFPRAGLREDSPQPIFIIGFPRSGTTLVEQTLASHPSIAAGDELPIIGTLAPRMQSLLGAPFAYPMALSELWLGDRAGQINSLRDLYLNEAAQMGAVDSSKRWFTDKMPLNETHLGLIHLLFPKSPIIHLVRHPLDVVLSVFSNLLTHGFNCASGLETAAQHYALIADLIAHYRAVMPLNYHAVRYEELIADQEGGVRKLLDFIGEPFDPATLAFHENARPARTASYAQVTEKLYTRSVYRYRNYLKHLEPVIPILMPAIERLGYRIETQAIRSD